MKISIITPSRGRTKGLERLIYSVQDTMSGLLNIEIIVGIDNDDIKKNEYRQSIKQIQRNCANYFNVTLIEGERKPVAEIWNELSLRCSGDWLMCGNDDLIFKTKKWDLILAENIKKRHCYYLYWFDDGLQHANLSAFPIVSRKWVNVLGYFFPTNFKHNYPDTWLFDIAKKSLAYHYIPEVLIEHLHYSNHPEVEIDQTYLDAGDRSVFDSDTREFVRTEYIRISESIKIKNAYTFDQSLGC